MQLTATIKVQDAHQAALAIQKIDGITEIMINRDGSVSYAGNARSFHHVTATLARGGFSTKRG